MSSAGDLETLVQNSKFSSDQIDCMINQIRDELVCRSTTIRSPNFEEIGSSDLKRLFDLYDHHFFSGQCQIALGESPLTFRISSRMTRAGGKTTRIITRRSPRHPSYEIAVSSTLLFETFDVVDRKVLVTGLECRNRLDALQRIFEHELIHLIELLVWNTSSCAKKRFQGLAANYFNHADYRHELVTPRERALKQHGIQTGNHVEFIHDGDAYIGVVNRITKRATVLVEDRKGRKYSDGRRYLKFYVPVEKLKRIE